MANKFYAKPAYGQNQPTENVFPFPVVSKRAPTSADTGYPLGILWLQPVNTSNVAVNSAWILVSIINNLATWNLLESSGGAGVFASLTVTPGPTNLTGVLTQVGTVNMNVTGAAATNIGTGGTGVVNIGNATGNTVVTGNLTASGTITGSTLYASGDAGGVALENALSNVSVPVAGGTGAFTITSATTAGAAVNAGFIKMYVGVTAVYVPYYLTTA